MDDVEERRLWRPGGVEPFGAIGIEPVVFPDAGEIRLAVRRPWRGRRQVRFAVGSSRHSSRRMFQPLGGKRGGAEAPCQDNEAEHERRGSGPAMHREYLHLDARVNTIKKESILLTT
jgi:hypothetical protein